MPILLKAVVIQCRQLATAATSAGLVAIAACDVGESSELDDASVGGTSSAGSSSGGSSNGGASSSGGSTGASGGTSSGGGGTTSGGSSGSAAGGSGGSGPEIIIGCDGGTGDASQPFANHEFSYAAGILPSHVSQTELDNGVRDFYDDWKARYLKTGCGGHYVSIETGDLTVSEAHGYGMIIAAYMAGYDADAKTIFDGLYAYFRSHPSVGNPQLMAWKQDQGCNSTDGGHSATDGDLDIAYALLLADKQWGSGGATNYRNEANLVARAILDSETGPGNAFVQLGDWINPGDSEFYNATRSSDFMPGHFESFSAVLGRGEYDSVTNGTYGIFSSVRSGYSSNTGLMPDFILAANGDPYPAYGGFLERNVDGEYSFNACRVPFRVGVHYLTTGDSRAEIALDTITNWLKGRTNGNPSQISAGYWLDGDPLPSSEYSSMAFRAPFAVAAMVGTSHQTWLNDMWDDVRWADSSVYYDDAIKMLSMIALSGNWWAPEVAACPE